MTFGAIAAFLTIIVEFIFTKDLVSITPLIAQSLEKRNLMGFIIVSTIEEIMKFLVVYILLHINKFFNEAIDAMMYMIIAAIGFSMVENALAIFGQLKISLSLTFPIQIIIARFLGANLLHIICSGIIGFF
ncbi:MAG TPA: PrsW family glutamic-type intramembrane protease [Candidatus Paceibacterota bacterium]|nr:PrsW family glutamic-type intramembrane protease [Candidatus Paceibacterota bacterium]